MKILNKIPKDKLLHFFVGYVTFTFSLIFVTPLVALAVTAVIALAKELWDSRTHKPEFLDFLATVAPGAAFVIILGKEYV